MGNNNSFDIDNCYTKIDHRNSKIDLTKISPNSLDNILSLNKNKCLCVIIHLYQSIFQLLELNTDDDINRSFNTVVEKIKHFSHFGPRGAF